MEGSTPDYTVLVAVIGTISAILVAMLSSAITYIVARYNFRTPKTRSILEEQYIKVLVPLHKLIYMEKGNIHDKIEKSLKIVTQEYMYVPIRIINDLRSLRENEDESKFYEYAGNIHMMLLLVRRKLGYDFRQKEEEPRPYITSNIVVPDEPPGGPVIVDEESLLGNIIRSGGKKIRFVIKRGKIKEDTPIGHKKNNPPAKRTR